MSSFPGCRSLFLVQGKTCNIRRFCSGIKLEITMSAMWRSFGSAARKAAVCLNGSSGYGRAAISQVVTSGSGTTVSDPPPPPPPAEKSHFGGLKVEDSIWRLLGKNACGSGYAFDVHIHGCDGAWGHTSV